MNALAARALLTLCAALACIGGGYWWGHGASDNAWEAKQAKTDKKVREKLAALVEANRGKRGFTYTHKPMDNATNRRFVREANRKGFTVNLSADNLREADTLASLGIGPVATLLPRLQSGGRGVKLFTPAGRRVIVCPAQTHEHVTCASCKLCALADRPFIVGFLAHGSSVRKAEAVFNGDLFSA